MSTFNSIPLTKELISSSMKSSSQYTKAPSSFSPFASNMIKDASFLSSNSSLFDTIFHNHSSNFISKVKQVNVISQKMHKRRIWPEGKAFINRPVTKKALNLITELKTSPPENVETLYGMLRRWTKYYKPIRRDLMDAIKELDNKTMRELCFQVMEWSLREDWYEPNVRDYTKLMERYGREGRVDDMERIMHGMDEDGFSADCVCYSVLISAYGKLGLVEKAETKMAEMYLIGIRPDLQTYSSLIACYGYAGRVEKAEAVLKEMEAYDIEPTIITYNILMTAYARKGMANDAKRIFERMIHYSRLIPDFKSFTTLLHAYSKAGEEENALNVFKEMKSFHKMVDDTALSLLVLAFSKKGKYKEAVSIVVNEEKNGRRPELETYSALIDLFGRNGLILEAQEVYDEMLSRRFSPDAKTYARLYFAYAKAGDLERTKVIFSEMKDSGWFPNSINSELMIEGLISGGLFHEALFLEESMMNQGVKCTDAARKMLDEMKNKLKLDSHVLNSGELIVNSSAL